MDYADKFEVSCPMKNITGGYIQYTITGVKGADEQQFCIKRRFREFHALRNSLKERF